MRYQLKQIYCRPWLLLGLSPKLLESHYENNYGGALRRLNAISEQLASLDFASTPGHVINGLKREELVALNSTLLHELYFASLGGDGKPKPALAQALARDFGSVERWRSEFTAMAYALGGGSGRRYNVHRPSRARGAAPGSTAAPSRAMTQRTWSRSMTAGEGLRKTVTLWAWNLGLTVRSKLQNRMGWTGL